MVASCNSRPRLGRRRIVSWIGGGVLRQCVGGALALERHVLAVSPDELTVGEGRASVHEDDGKHHEKKEPFEGDPNPCSKAVPLETARGECIGLFFFPKRLQLSSPDRRGLKNGLD
jgi:hypothetical protein